MRWVTVREMAENIRIHPRTILRWVKNGEVCAHRIGKKWYILVREVHGVYFPVAEDDKRDK